LNAVEIEQAIFELAAEPFDANEFPYKFLIAFGNPDTTIRRLRAGNNNKSDIPNGVLQRTNIHIGACGKGKVKSTLAALKASPETSKAKAKFILATDGDEFQAEDLNSGEIIACDYTEFVNHFGFFLPLAGISTVKQIRDNPIDIQATSRLNLLYVELLKTNEGWAERRYDMNQFMGRLIFCFFVEDTDIFNGDDLFIKTIEQMSDSRSDNTGHVLQEIFRTMDIKYDNRAAANLPRWASPFPYVNGGLFAGTRDVPKFNRAARSYLLHAGSLNWKEINPDIFGSMIQAVADEEERGALGMHYTSVPNILKVLNPLFLDDLRTQLDEAGDNGRKLLNLKKRMSRIRVFDPACGSGNFLVIAYKEMRMIEFKINQRRGEEHLKSEIPLSNFRGIEIREFPAEIARLSLIIAEFQCDVLYRGQKDALRDFLPLDSKNWIVRGNALRLDWLSICPPTGTSVKHAAEDLFHTPLDQVEIEFENKGGETFICGNPPYKGSQQQNVAQKEEVENSFSSITGNTRTLDYVCGWIGKAAKYLKFTAGSAAFVVTNSVNQGRQVDALWGPLFSLGISISFAVSSFKWSNLATKNAGVTVSIIGITLNPRPKRLLFHDDGDKFIAKEVHNINGYLVAAPNIEIVPFRDTISDLPKMLFGNMPNDGGALLLDAIEATQIIRDGAPEQFIRPFVGSFEFIHGISKFCIWVHEKEFHLANDSQALKQRFEMVRAHRLNSNRSATKNLAEIPYAFGEVRQKGNENVLLIPRITSELREYLPVGLIEKGSIISSQNFAIYSPPMFALSILASKLHRAWVGVVCGRTRTDIAYSNTLGWNTFPAPKFTEKNKKDLARCAEDILLARESHFPKTIGELYDSEKMPENLRSAHDRNDEALERIYIGRRFRNDTERLEKLFEIYSKMTTLPKAT